MSPPAQPHDSSRTLTVPTALTARQQLITLYQAAVAGAQPEAATAAAIPSLDLSPTGRLWLIALGKAAPRMTAGALVGLRARDVELAGGVVVAPNTGQSLHARLTSVGGDHPIPGTRSVRAAEALGDIVAGVGAGDDVIVLVSGGGSSLIAAPAPDVPEFTSDDVTALYAALMASGIDIRIMNAVRRRFTRWGGGRLAVALARAGARVHCLVVSDVPGDDAAVVSSGPCAPDPLTAGALIAALRQTAAWTGMPERARAHLTAVERGSAPEAPKPDDPAFQAVATQVILANGHALRAAADAARALGINEVTISRESLAGEAAIFGVRLASELIARVARARRTGGTTAAGGRGADGSLAALSGAARRRSPASTRTTCAPVRARVMETMAFHSGPSRLAARKAAGIKSSRWPLRARSVMRGTAPRESPCSPRARMGETGPRMRPARSWTASRGRRLRRRGVIRRSISPGTTPIVRSMPRARCCERD